MKNVRVAILDTGIADEIMDDRIKFKIHIYYDYYAEEIVINKFATDYNGHGTMCVNTIWDRFPNVDIYVIKILNISGMTNSMVFLKALKYVEKLDVEIISICASYIVDTVEREIEEQCNRMVQSGKIIIASVQNGERSSAIANYNNVIGVIGGVMEDKEFYYSETSDIQMQCSSRASIVQSVRTVRDTFQGNSRATAIATGTLCEMLFKTQGNKKNMSILLQKKAVSNIFQKKQYDSPHEDVIYQKFDKKKELFYAEHDKRYQKFIYLLCEFYMCEESKEIRQAYLIEYENGRLFRYLEDILRLIEERFGVNLLGIKVEKLQWAYLFYENYIRGE